MNNNILIEVTNNKALKLLHHLEELHLIKVLEENIQPSQIKLSEKYRGVFTTDDANSFDEHTEQDRKEWDNSQ
jgi:hypothetical protein